MNDAFSSPLRCHPASPVDGVGPLNGEVCWLASGDLRLRYRVCAAAGVLRLPAAMPSGPADGLWQHTCCEAFLAAVDGPDYREFNFSPSGQWAVYDFCDYRQRDASFQVVAAPLIVCTPAPDGFVLEALVPAALLPAEKALAVSLTAVIESGDGHQSYWAVHHASARPDFHLRQSFVLSLQKPTP